MTPLGHLSVSYISGKSIRNISVPAIIIGGILPDFDFLFFFFDWFNQVHRVLTHNLFFIVLAALAASFFTMKGRKKTVGTSMFLGGLLHLIIDSCMDNNPSNGMGIAVLWPVSDMFFLPFNILALAENPAGWNDPVRMFKSLLPTMIYEVPAYAVSLFLIFRKNKVQLSG